MEPIDEEIPDRIAENDPSTFGQLVPVLLISLTLFTFMQVISGKFGNTTSGAALADWYPQIASRFGVNCPTGARRILKSTTHPLWFSTMVVGLTTPKTGMDSSLRSPSW